RPHSHIQTLKKTSAAVGGVTAQRRWSCFGVCRKKHANEVISHWLCSSHWLPAGTIRARSNFQRGIPSRSMRRSLCFQHQPGM
ncbi:hypothetical protein AMECASPLE_035821, partial [Ameca splendens]